MIGKVAPVNFEFEVRTRTYTGKGKTYNSFGEALKAAKKFPGITAFECRVGGDLFLFKRIRDVVFEVEPVRAIPDATNEIETHDPGEWVTRSEALNVVKPYGIGEKKFLAAQKARQFVWRKDRSNKNWYQTRSMLEWVSGIVMKKKKR